MIGGSGIVLAAALFALPLAMNSQADTTNVIRVMTFNLRYASAPDGDNSWENANQSPPRREIAARVITDYAPDIVGFQEGQDAQLDFLDARVPDVYAFVRQKPSGGGGLENAAFAYNTNTLELLDAGVFSLGPRPGSGYWNNEPGANFDPYAFFPGLGMKFPRLALWGRFRWRASNQEFLFYTTHFDFNDEPQVGSASLILNDARARSSLAIVVGDFNSTQDRRAWKLFTGSFTTNGRTGDFTDSWLQTHRSADKAGTFHSFNGGVIPANARIDWILHRGGFVATSAAIITDAPLATNLTTHVTRPQYPSDHYPIYATLMFPRAEETR